MVDERNKPAASNQQQPLDKNLARRERQAQSLRRNLVRRKAQVRERIQERTGDDVSQDPPQVAKDEPSQE